MGNILIGESKWIKALVLFYSNNYILNQVQLVVLSEIMGEMEETIVPIKAYPFFFVSSEISSNCFLNDSSSLNNLAWCLSIISAFIRLQIIFL